MLEGKEAADHRKQRDAGRPDVNRVADIPRRLALASEHLRRGVARRAARVLQDLARRALGREAKVDDPDVAIAVEEEVLRLDVAVDDIIRVEVRDAGDNLLEEALALVLAQPALRRERGERCEPPAYSTHTAACIQTRTCLTMYWKSSPFAANSMTR